MRKGQILAECKRLEGVVVGQTAVISNLKGQVTMLQKQVESLFDRFMAGNFEVYSTYRPTSGNDIVVGPFTQYDEEFAGDIIDGENETEGGGSLS